MTLEEWIKNPSDYKAGVELYNAYGKSPQLKKIFALSGATAKNKSTLLYELKKIFNSGSFPKTSIPLANNDSFVIEKAKVKTISQPHTSERLIVYDPDNEVQQKQSAAEIKKFSPSLIDDIEKEWKEKYKRAHYVKTQIIHMRSTKKRAESALLVLDLFDEIEAIWKKLDYYKANGHLPEETAIQIPEINNPAELIKRRNNLRTYISSAKKGKSKYRTADKIPVWEKEIGEIDLKLQKIAHE